MPEEIGYRNVFRILKPGGAFARFANHPYQAKDNPVLFKEIQNAYAEYYYPYYQKQPGKLSEYTEEQAAARAEIANRHGFTDVQYNHHQTARKQSGSVEKRLLIHFTADEVKLK